MRISILCFVLLLLFSCENKESDKQVFSATKSKEELVEVLEEESNYEEEIPFNPLLLKDSELKHSGFSFVVHWDKTAILALTKLDTTCYFLSHRDQKLVKARTLRHDQWSDEMFELEVTITDIPLKAAVNLVYIGGEVQVDWIEIVKIKTPAIIDSIEAEISLAENFADAFKESESPLSMYLTEIKKGPIVRSFRFKGLRYFLATFILSEHTDPEDILYGPTFLLSPTKTYPLTGPCSFGEPDIFQMNEKLILQSGSNCCDCGVVIDQLFEFDGENLELILEDGSMST